MERLPADDTSSLGRSSRSPCLTIRRPKFEAPFIMDRVLPDHIPRKSKIDSIYAGTKLLRGGAHAQAFRLFKQDTGKRGFFAQNQKLLVRTFISKISRHSIYLLTEYQNIPNTTTVSANLGGLSHSQLQNVHCLDVNTLTHSCKHKVRQA
jgi:hypothetical protein